MATTRSTLATEILKGEHDSLLDELYRAITSRKKVMFTKGTKVRLIGTGSASLEGREATVVRVGTKRITVDFGDGGRGMYVPTSMLEIV